VKLEERVFPGLGPEGKQGMGWHRVFVLKKSDGIEKMDCFDEYGGFL
jgi:hypothetical protein